jgi:Mrp family chromosome partitioning ATPase/capsular polysaccharide biosynthesis protein
MSRNEGTGPPAGDTGRSQEGQLDLRAYARPIWRWKWLVLLMVILAAGGAYALTRREAKTYESASLVYVQNADPAASVGGQASSGTATQELQDIATLFTGQAITATVYQKLHLPIGSAGTVVVSPSSSSDFITVTATSHSPGLAARLANTYVRVFFASQANSVRTAALAAAHAAHATLHTIPSTSASNQAERATLEAQIADYKAQARNPSSGAQVIDTAAVPAVPISPKPERDAIFAGLIGLLLGIGLAFVLDLADRRLIRVSSVQSIYDRSVLAVIPHVSNPAPKVKGSISTPPEFVEVMRSLRVNLRLSAANRPLNSVMVTSGLPSEGKSTVVRGLALAYAEAGERVLVVDGDLRRPSLARLFNIKPDLGLVQVLRGELAPGEAAMTVFGTRPSSSNGSAGQTSPSGDLRAHGSIDVIAHGGKVDNPAALISSSAMTSLLAKAAQVYGIVIVDTSPVLTVSDAVPLLSEVSAVLFVARLGMTTREAAERLAELGERVPKMNLAGVVVNDMRGRYVDEGFSFYSKYGYDYSRRKA